MVTLERKPVDTERARKVWSEYQERHDLSPDKGKVAAIDPVSGRIWIGDTGVDVADKIHADGLEGPVYLVRVGFDHFIRKGRR